MSAVIKPEFDHSTVEIGDYLSSLWENSPLGILVFDQNCFVIDVNRTYLDFFQIQKEDLIGLSAIEALNHIYLRWDVEGAIETDVKGTYWYYGFGTLKNGRKVRAKIRDISLFDSDNKQIRTIREVEFLDDDLEEDAVKTNNTSSYGLMSLVRNLSDIDIFANHSKAILILDLNMRICYYNRHCQEILGLRKREMLKKYIWELAYNHVVSTDINVTNQEVLNGTSESYRQKGHVALKDGRHLEILFEMYPIRLNRKTISGILLAIENIDEEKQNRRNELRNRFNLIGEMSANLANEIRNPMTTIRGLAQILSERYPRESSHFQLIMEEIDQADQVIAAYLNLNPNQPSYCEYLDIAAVLRESVNLLLPGIFTNSVRVILDNSRGDEYVVWGDRQQLKQALINLILNAMEASQPGQMIKVTGTRQNDHWIAVIADSGCGIPEEKLDRTFMPGYTTKENRKGLGLPVALRIIQDHNGDISVDSIEDQGTKVTITLPLVKNEQ
ncbi:MAG: ATP-binding protein [Chitinophagales bacterium]